MFLSYCHIHSDLGGLNGIITINEPSIIRMPCGNKTNCANTELPSSTCTNRSILIKLTATGHHHQLSTIPWSIKNMTKELVSAYNLMLKKILKTYMLDDLTDNRLSVITTIKEFGAIALSVLFLLLLSCILLFLRWIKRMIQKRINKLEKDVDDLAHEII